MVALDFVAGTLELRGADAGVELPRSFRWDARAACHRAPALDYAELVLALRRQEVPLEDHARRYLELELGARLHRTPRPYQKAALAAWRKAQGRGVVVLPTGAGKSHVAVMAIDDRRRSALVVVPTLDLVRQWYDLLRTSFGVPVGIVGGGEHTVEPLTVTTYDSAYIHMEHLGARFGLVVFDECHHLPGATYQLAAELCLAPFRLGLSATPERADGREAALARLIGPVVFEKPILDLSGEYLADYETERLSVELSPAEREEYEAERGIYTGFLRAQGIHMSGASGWSDFVIRSSRSEEGRRAMRAYRRQREIAFAAPAKLDVVEHLLSVHRADKTLIFTQDNATAYAVSRRFLVPAITHQTKVRERSDILERFSDGRYRVVVTSKVLNEGVDVPDASVAIVISGSGSVREHVQRLGRILRPRDDKRAVLYELVSERTSESFTSERRREHDAYR
ncbi:MAG: DEAD/DEAH box helicase family protein [Myxococcales bacterium]|nr:DEAD/DEAH box helicase family protein [Myxococcales bacterium]MCB9577362.1 DEAD/DEAH box helicase [Polyangiaceae bacterium]